MIRNELSGDAGICKNYLQNAGCIKGLVKSLDLPQTTQSGCTKNIPGNRETPFLREVAML